MNLHGAFIGAWILLIVPGLAEGTASTTKIMRGPYLQTGTPTEITIRWRTDKPATSVVQYGLSVANLAATATGTSEVTEHVVLLSMLQPNTRYYYSIGATNEAMAGGNGTFHFVTAPLPGTPKPTRVWVLGDPGTKDRRQRAVRDGYYLFAGRPSPDLWLMLGDNAYKRGSDKNYQEAVFNLYPQTLATSVLWPTLGNHDGYHANSDRQSGAYYHIFSLPAKAQAGGIASGTEAFYSFNYANIHFISLNSLDTDRSPHGPMLAWLKKDLGANPQTWTIVFFHHPPYTKGSHDSDGEIKDTRGRMKAMRKYVLPILDAGGADLVLTGHSHSYERSFLLDGHYGKSTTLTAAMIKDRGDGRVDGRGAYHKSSLKPAPHEGAVYVVAGSAGQTSGGKLNHPAMAFSANELGSLVIDVHGPRLDAAFVNTNAAILDHFTIMKGPTGRSR